MVKLNSTQKAGLSFGSAFVIAGVILSAIVFPFWLIDDLIF